MFHFSFSRFLFVIGFICGVFLAIVLVNKQSEIRVKKNPFHNYYKNWLKNSNIHRKLLEHDQIRYGFKNYTLEFQYLFNKIPILCLVLTKNEKNYQAAKATWAKGCNKLDTINLVQKSSVIKKRKSSWLSICEYFKNVPIKFKWVIVVYDYTFIITENLRLFLTALNPSKSYYLGHPVKFWGVSYNTGQAGYVLSQNTLKKIKENIDCSKNPTYNNKEDYYLGRYLAELNITPIDTSDVDGLTTFHPYNWNHLLDPENGFFKNSIYPNKCCSPYSVTFQAIEADKMYMYNYLLYTIQIFKNGNLGNRPRPQKWVHEETIWRDFLKSRNITTDGNITSEQYYKVWEDLVDDPLSFASKMRREEL